MMKFDYNDITDAAHLLADSANNIRHAANILASANWAKSPFGDFAESDPFHLSIIDNDTNAIEDIRNVSSYLLNSSVKIRSDAQKVLNLDEQALSQQDCSLDNSAENITSAQTPVVDSIKTPLGELGQFMLQSDHSRANWLGQTYNGKILYEPINIVIHDTTSNNVTDARNKILQTMSYAGYPSRFGHSTGYTGYINGQYYTQEPTDLGSAFSDGNFWESNNHIRLLGPAVSSEGKGYIWVGSASRQNVGFPEGSIIPNHVYSSFDNARDDLTQHLSRISGTSIQPSINMGNTIDTSSATTGDHDGMASVIQI